MPRYSARSEVGSATAPSSGRPEARAEDAASLRDKVQLLRSPDTYTPRPDAVEVIETHMSWVFLTDRYAYKLKKPIRYDVLDFSSLALRRRSCEREVHLNRRLARDVYLEVVPLTVEPDGELRLAGSGEPADWLVKMRRLPEDRTLEQLITRGAVRREDVRSAAALLGAFYANAIPAPVDAAGYVRHLRRGIRADLEELVKERYGLPGADVRLVAGAQLQYVKDAEDTLSLRVSAGRVVEGHGDLRPEHIFLTDPPAIIDCLEFSRDLRLLDPLDELSFLALECDRLGAPEVGGWFLDVYRDATGDDSPPDLLAFYRRFRALRRAKVAVWHVRDAGIEDHDRWRERAKWYLTTAVASLASG
jgi:uncharacterized protein